MRRRKGSVTVEFAMVGIPLIFALISTVEMARGMWIYQTQAYAVNAGARYVVVHGVDCAGVGLVPSQWTVTLYSASGTNNQTCSPLSSCFGNGTAWPPSPDNQVGNGIAITGSYPFSSALAMFFPGTAPTHFGTYALPAYSQQLILF